MMFSKIRVAAAVLAVASLGWMGCAQTRSQPPKPVTVTTITDRLFASGGVSVGADGTVYVADFGPSLRTAGGKDVYRLTPAGPAVFTSGFGGASGNSFGPDGWLYQSDVGRGEAYRINAQGEREQLAEGLSSPVGIVAMAGGAVYVNECTANAVTRIDPDGTKTRIAEGGPINCPNGLTVGPDGDLYLVNFRDSNMVRVDLPSGEATVFAVIPGGGNGHLTVANGRFYVASFRGHQIHEVTFDGTVRLLAGTGEPSNYDGPGPEATFFRPNGMAASVTGDTLYTNTITNIVSPGDNSLYPNVVRMITGVHGTLRR